MSTGMSHASTRIASGKSAGSRFGMGRGSRRNPAADRHPRGEITPPLVLHRAPPGRPAAHPPWPEGVGLAARVAQLHAPAARDPRGVAAHHEPRAPPRARDLHRVLDAGEPAERGALRAVTSRRAVVAAAAHEEGGDGQPDAGGAAHQSMFIATYLISRYSWIPSAPPSRPKPDALTPPNGAAGLDTRPWLRPTIPVSSFSQTRKARLTSRV